MWLPRWLGGKESTCQWDPWVRKIPWSRKMSTHSCILAWKIPWTEEPGGLQSIESQRVGQDWATGHTHTQCIHINYFISLMSFRHAYTHVTYIPISMSKSPIILESSLMFLWSKSSSTLTPAIHSSDFYHYSLNLFFSDLELCINGRVECVYFCVVYHSACFQDLSMWLRLSLVSFFFFFFYFFFFLIFKFKIFYWFCHISKWIRPRYTCVPHPEPSSLLPPHTIPLGRHSAPAPSIQYRASNLDWRLVSYVILYMFQCHSPWGNQNWKRHMYPNVHRSTVYNSQDMEAT